MVATAVSIAVSVLCSGAITSPHHVVSNFFLGKVLSL